MKSDHYMGLIHLNQNNEITVIICLYDVFICYLVMLTTTRICKTTGMISTRELPTDSFHTLMTTDTINSYAQISFDLFGHTQITHVTCTICVFIYSVSRQTSLNTNIFK